jgi:hypothetical protein
MLAFTLLGGAAIFIAGGAWLIKRQIDHEFVFIKSAQEEALDLQWKTIIVCRMLIKNNLDKKDKLRDVIIHLQVRGSEKRFKRVSMDPTVLESAVDNIWLDSRTYNELVVPWLEGTYDNKKLIAKVADCTDTYLKVL